MTTTEAARTINCPITKAIPVNTITVSIRKGLNHEGLGAVMNSAAKNTEKTIVTKFIRSTWMIFTPFDNMPTTRTGRNVIMKTNKGSTPVLN